MEQEQEFIDRQDTKLPGVQEDLVEHLAHVASRPIIVVIMSGGSVNLERFKTNPRIGAILYVGYPGQAGGISIAQTIFGDNNPSGRLSHTFYRSNFVDRVSMYDYNMRPNPATGNPGRTYRFHQDPVVYPFGHGLSYTKFQFHWIQPHTFLSCSDLNKQLDQTIQFKVKIEVRNVGPFDGDTSVLCFAIPPEGERGKNGNPIRSLVTFERVSLASNTTQTLELSFSAVNFAVPNVDGEFTILSGIWRLDVEEAQHFVHILEKNHAEIL